MARSRTARVVPVPTAREVVASALALLLFALATFTCVAAGSADAGPWPSGVTAEAADTTAHIPGVRQARSAGSQARSAVGGGDPKAACPGKPKSTAVPASSRAAGYASVAPPHVAGWPSVPSRVPADRNVTGHADRAPPSPEPILLLCVLRI